MDRPDEEFDSKVIDESNGREQNDACRSEQAPHPNKTVRLTSAKDDSKYNMGHKRRGLAVIFNHTKFEMAELSVREGTEHDKEALTLTLKELGYEVKCHDDWTYDQISKELLRLSKLDHTDCDSIVIAVFSHGKKGRLYSRDKSYKSRILSDPFAADKCKSLAGKPKIFFLQACQGGSRDSGTSVMFQEKIYDAEPFEDSYNYAIPNHADFLMCYAAVPGHVSIRNCDHGTWFIQSLCKVLRQHHQDMHLLDMMTYVNRVVAFEYETECDKIKQIPCIESMLTRAVYFEPKEGDNEY